MEQATSHPNWSMGKKITVDSATLMNKGLEVIEAHYLFGASYDDIEVVVHPQSVIHSMIETQDSSVLAQVEHDEGAVGCTLLGMWQVGHPVGSADETFRNGKGNT